MLSGTSPEFGPLSNIGGLDLIKYALRLLKVMLEPASFVLELTNQI